MTRLGISLARIVAWGLATAIVVLSVVPPTLRPETSLPHPLEHFALYWATGLAFALGYELKPGLLAILLVFFSGAVEIAQLFVPGRHARLSDFIVDALAITIGAMTVSLVPSLVFVLECLGNQQSRSIIRFRKLIKFQKSTNRAQQSDNRTTRE